MSLICETMQTKQSAAAHSYQPQQASTLCLVAKQAIRCILHQLAENHIFTRIFSMPQEFGKNVNLR